MLTSTPKASTNFYPNQKIKSFSCFRQPGVAQYCERFLNQTNFKTIKIDYTHFDKFSQITMEPPWQSSAPPPGSCPIRIGSIPPFTIVYHPPVSFRTAQDPVCTQGERFVLFSTPITSVSARRGENFYCTGHGGKIGRQIERAQIFHSAAVLWRSNNTAESE